MTLLGIVCAGILVWWITKYFAGTDKARIMKFGRLVGGAAALLTAGILAFRGRMDMALLVGGGGGWLLGWNALPPPFGAGGLGQKATGGFSRVRSRVVEVELDHDSGKLGGTVLSGPYAGRKFDALSETELVRLHGECVVGDPDGARLLETYLDRRFPRWREHAEARVNERRGPEPQLGAMSKEEAYEVLGLQPGAAEAAIRDAHRLLMKRLHPDQGGTTYLASRVNQAKDVLLNRHR